MIYLMYGAGGMLVILTVFFFGGFLGWKACEGVGKYNRKRTAQEATQEQRRELAAQEQRRELAAQQQAFEEMLRYNQDTAYGIGAGVEVLRGDEGQ